MLSLASTALGAQGDPCQPAWTPAHGGLPGVSGSVLALATFDDGRGPALHVAGNFETAGGVAANNVARWDGARWTPLAGGVGNRDFYAAAMVVFDDGRGPALYVAGYFPDASGVRASNVARWDGARWTAVGTGLNNAVNALAVFDDGTGPALHAGGFFTSAGSTVSRIARWNGTRWVALGSGTNDTVYALAVFDDGRGPALYAGGVFGLAGGVSASRIARWNGASWSALGSGVDDRVAALAVFDDGRGPALYAAGQFDRAGSAAANRVARWNGARWSALGSGVSTTGVPAAHVEALAVFDDGGGPALFAAGRFTRAGGLSANHVARWNGASWTRLASGLSFPSGVEGSAFALAVFDAGDGPALHAGGTFTGAGGARAHGVARWNGAVWSCPGSGANDEVAALAVFDDRNGGGPALFAGGALASAGGVRVNHVARWNGAHWTALGPGTNGAVEALAAFDGGAGPVLCAGGDFTSAGGAPANGVASWDGKAWAPLGAGTGGPVLALETFDDGRGPALFAGGDFTSAGGAPASGVARWDGARWTPLGPGLSGAVAALAVFDDGRGPALFAGGEFEETGAGAVVNHVARWSGTAWEPLGSGVEGQGVGALAVHDDGRGRALFAGGTFTRAGGVAASHVARWDGASWSSLGSGLASGMDQPVEVLAVLDDGAGPALFAGGRFTSAGGAAASRLARWDGRHWTPLGSGLSGAVLALAAFDDLARGGPVLHAGGAFTRALDSGDAFLARWRGCADTTAPVLSCPTSIAVSDPRSGPPGEVVTFTVTAGDERDPSPAVVCTPPSGSLFPPGVTLVVCKATDAARNQSSCSFPVTVLRK